MLLFQKTKVDRQTSQPLEREVVGVKSNAARSGGAKSETEPHVVKAPPTHTNGGGTKHVTHDQTEVGEGGHHIYVLCLTLGLGQ